MLFLVAFTFGRHSAAALVHFAYLCTLPLLMVCWGRRFGLHKAGLFAAILIFASPVIAKDGISAYNDLAVATLIYAVFYLLQVWDESKSPNLLILIGLLSGAAYGAKYTAFLTLPFALAWVCFSARRHFPNRRNLLLPPHPRARHGRPLDPAQLVLARQPVRPLLQFLVPQPLLPCRHGTYLCRIARATIPASSITGRFLCNSHCAEDLSRGMFGPVFLLAPFGLLALRFKSGRRLLLAALVFALPAYLNTGTRFLIPSAPFLALAMGIGLAEVPAALPVLALFHALVSWPPVLSTYCDPWNWRIASFPRARRPPPGSRGALHPQEHRGLRPQGAHRTGGAPRRAHLLLCRPPRSLYRPRHHRLLRVHLGQPGAGHPLDPASPQTPVRSAF